MRPLRLACFASLSLIAACAPRYRQDSLGTGTAVVGSSAGVAAPGSGGVTIATAGEHRIDWSIWTPRAMRLTYTIDCGGTQEIGVAGETFEEYRDRRIAEIRYEREQQRKAMSAIGGAVLGQVGAGAQVATPAAQGSAEVAVDGEAVGGAVADQVISDDVVLPAGDVGGGSYGGTLRIGTVAAGACTMALAPALDGDDPTGVQGQFKVTRIVDLAAERQAERVRVRTAAIEVRGDLGARLVAHGADPELRIRLAAEAAARAQAEAAARAEIEARAQAERTARIEAELRVSAEVDARARAEAQAELDAELAARAEITVEVVTTRQSYLAYLVGVCGADPDHRDRLRRERDAADARLRASVIARGQIAIDIRSRIATSLIGYGADPDYRRKRADAAAHARAEIEARDQAAYQARVRVRAEFDAELERRAYAAAAIRAEVSAYLRRLGAIERPPMPDPIDEDRGEAIAGATWIDGEWHWQDARWVWIAGGWSFSGSGFGDAGSVSVDVSAGRTVVVEHRDPDPAPAPVTVRAPDPAPVTITVDVPVTIKVPAPRVKKPRPKHRDHR